MNAAKSGASISNAQTVVLVCVTVALAALLFQLQELTGGNSNSKLLAEELRPTFQSAREYRLLSLADTIERLAIDQVALQGALSDLHAEMPGELALLQVGWYDKEIAKVNFVSTAQKTIVCSKIEQLRTAAGSVLTEYPLVSADQAERGDGSGSGILKVHYWTCRVQ